MFAKIAIGAAVAATVTVSGYALMPAVPRIPAPAQVAPALTGMSSPENLRSNIDALGLHLSPEQRRRLDEASEEVTS